MNGELPPPAQEGELSVRAKAFEARPGVYVTRSRAVPVRIGKCSIEGAGICDDLETITAKAEGEY